MPYIRPFADGYAFCAPHASRAMLVSQSTIDEWDRLCAEQGTTRPVTPFGYRLRIYPEMNVARHAPYAPDGVYTDHSDPAVESEAYAMRDRLLRQAQGSRQEVLQTIATVLRMRHWRDAYNATRNVGRRETGESGRNRDGDLVWRRWSRTYSAQSVAAATTRAAASGSRCVGVELEFNHDGGSYGSVFHWHHDIARAARAAGLEFSEHWTSYGSVDHGGRRRAPTGWLGTADSTVTGGEIISDILPGDDAAMDEIRIMLAIIRDHGGRAAERQGTHVHVDCRDLSVTDKVRLVDNVRIVAPILESYLPASRRNGYWCGRMDAYAWDRERSSVAAGRGGSGSHTNAYNFGHLYSSSPRIEFRQFGHSLNSTKLRCWIRVVQAIVTATASGYTFGPATTMESMLDALRTHGNLSAAAARRFADTVARRSGQPVAA